MRSCLIAFFLLCCAVWTPAEAEEPTLRIGLVGRLTTLNPFFARDEASRYALGFIHRPITAFNENWQLTCLLCTTLPTLENGLAVRDGDGLVLTVTLAEKAVWGDGTPITANDVRFSWQVARQLGALALPITDITVQDNKTFTVRYATLDYRYNWLHLLPLLPEHVEGIVFNRDFTAWPTQARYEQNPLDPGLYQGPYRVAERKADSLLLNYNLAWWGNTPYYRRILLRFFPTSEALLAEFKRGTIDIIPAQAQLAVTMPVHVTQQPAKPAKHFFGKMISSPREIPPTHRPVFTVNQFFEQLTVNHAHPALQDIRVRQALLHGIDREAINRAVYDGKAFVTDSPLHPLDTLQHGELQSLAYNPARARALLDEAGWVVDKTGRRRKEGQRLTLHLTTTGNDPARTLTQQILQNYWSALGIDVVLEAPTASTLFQTVLPLRRFSGLALYAWTAAPELAPFTALATKAVPTADNNYAGQNFGGFSDATMDRLLSALTGSVSLESRLAAWRVFQEHYARTLPGLPLFFLPEMDIVPLNLGGYEATGHEHPPSLWAERWLISEEP